MVQINLIYSQLFKKDIKQIFTLLSAILHLTNIKFSLDEETDGVFISDDEPLRIVASLLGIDKEKLATALVSTYSFTRCKFFSFFLWVLKLMKRF